MICTVVGARPNFIKMAPVIHELNRRGLPQLFVHTGQHYDAKMSAVFFDQLGMPQPDIYLGVGSGSHAEQTARVMTAFESACRETKFDLVVVAGDVNSTLACALTAAKLTIPVAHVESGLRSFDRTMPEEINRILTDHISDLLFTTELSGNENLAREGIEPTKIFYVGNSMIDSLRTHLDSALQQTPWEQYGFAPNEYGIVTLHRPVNVDHPATMTIIADALDTVSHQMPLLFPMHPRTSANGKHIWKETSRLRIVEPLGYLEFLGLAAKARVVITDSGGVQEETTALGIPCITLRESTERPITIAQGTNRLVPIELTAIVSTALAAQPTNSHRVPELWDGRAAVRIGDVIEEWWRQAHGSTTDQTDRA